jgi:hypothetical protein
MGTDPSEVELSTIGESADAGVRAAATRSHCPSIATAATAAPRSTRATDRLVQTIDTRLPILPLWHTAQAKTPCCPTACGRRLQPCTPQLIKRCRTNLAATMWHARSA